MTDRMHVAIAAQYASEDEAVADFDRLREHYKVVDKQGTFDAAVVRRDKEGKLDIAQRENDAGQHAAIKGVGLGLASGLLVAVFPAVALGGALLVAGGAGAGIGAIAGHVAQRSTSKDLEGISETLDAGSAGIVAVVDPAESEVVTGLLTGATRVTTRELTVDDDKLDDELRDAYE